ncbi:ribonuclease H-like protein [Xylaria sp. FL0933]|nr:ribonuclease H-like protein [Xylaria sp. FL0933]
MPRGWYLGQGLIPLGYSSSDDEEGPCELPDGRIVCGPHGLVCCGRCCSDYSFMDDIDDEMDDEDVDEDENGLLDAEIREMYENLSPEARSLFRSRYGSPPQSASARANTGDSRGQGPPSILIPSVFVGGPSARGTAAASVRTENSRDDDNLDVPSSVRVPGRDMIRGTGRVFPTIFTPPTTTVRPIELFPGKASVGLITRYIHRHDCQKALIFTDGACLNNGQSNPKAGWAFVHGPGHGFGPAITSSRLEDAGPFGGHNIQSSNRAELRAVIAALRFRAWDGEGFKTIVIATDSEYVTKGSTLWAKTWVRNGWVRNGSDEVKNKDLWEMLLGEAERWRDRGVSIEFWRIPREWNDVADAAAKTAAERDVTAAQWEDIFGLAI